MSVTAGMVKAVVVKGGGAGVPKDMKCEEIYACFDPKIAFGSHSAMQGSLSGHQAEHIIPTSVFHDMGRGGTKMAGCEGYSTGKATTWMVRDRQSANQEHKLLTDPMRQFSQANDLKGRNAPLSEWLDEYQKGAENALKNANPKRTVTDTSLDEDSLIKAAAECIRAEAAESFANMNPPVAATTPLRNSWPATNDQRAAAAQAQRQAARGGAGSGAV